MAHALAVGVASAPAEKPDTQIYFNGAPLTLERDDKSVLLVSTEGAAELARQARARALEKIGSFGNLRMRRARSMFGAREVIEVPSLAAGGGVIVPVALSPELEGLSVGEKEVYRTTDGEIRIVLGTITTKFYEAPTDAFAPILEELELDLEQQIESELLRFVPKSAEADVFTLAEELRRRPEVEWSEPDFAVAIDPFAVRTPSDIHYTQQWYLHDIKAPQAWARGVGEDSDRIVIAIIDDGLDIEHPDFAGKIVEGWDYILGRPIAIGTEQIAEQKGFHGTAVAGIAAARGDNRRGIAGVAWNARILPIRAMKASSPGAMPFAKVPDLAAAIVYAQEKGARVINLSWGDVRSDQILHAIRTVSERGALVVCAVGNGSREVSYPARLDECLAVGAVNQKGRRWKYSNHGPGRQSVDIMAPSGDLSLAGDIWTTDSAGDAGYVGLEEEPLDRSGDYMTKFGGTSAAAPIVAGAAALIWSRFPLLAADDVKEAILQEAVTPTRRAFHRTREYGRGLLDLDAAVATAERYFEELLEDPQTLAKARLDSAIWPTGRSWDSSTGRRRLTPDGEAVVVVVRAGRSPAWHGILRSSVAPPEEPDTEGGGIRVYRIPRSDLRPEEALQEQAAGGGLPMLYPAFLDEENHPALPLGSLVFKPLDGETLLEILAYARERGLVNLGEGPSLGTTRLFVDRASTLLDVFRAVRELSESGWTEWVEPELEVMILR